MGDPVPSSAISDATVGGLSVIVVTGGSDGDVLTQQADGTYAPEAPSAASGDVVGPSSATDNAIARFDTTTGKLLQNSSASIDDNGYLSAARLMLGTTSSFAMLKQGTSTEAGNVPGAVIKDAADSGYMALHARRLTASDGLIGCWNGSDWNGWVIYADILVGKSTGRIAWSNTSSSLGGTEDLKIVRVSAGLASVCGNSGLKVQNFAGNADAALTCGAITASGTVTIDNGVDSGILNLTSTAGRTGFIRHNSSNIFQFTAYSGDVTCYKPITIAGGNRLTCGNILPSAGITYNLGSTANQWNIAYISNIQFADTVNVVAAGVHGSGLLVYAESVIGPKFIGSGMRMPSGHRYEFSDGTSYLGTTDTAIGRDSAGVVGLYTTSTGSTKAALTCGAITASGLVCMSIYTVATLPSASANAYKEANVSDALAPAMGVAVVGGGSVKTKVRSNGTDWTVCGI